MERPPKRRIQITAYDFFTLTKNEIEVYHAILKETILNNKPCAQLSLSDLSEMTGLGRTTVAYQLEKLKNRRLIEIDDTQKTNTICIITTYKEIIR
ncbi:hypothetical protein ACFLU4_05570 [Chloroflexota bacterium]